MSSTGNARGNIQVNFVLNIFNSRFQMTTGLYSCQVSLIKTENYSKSLVAAVGCE